MGIWCVDIGRAERIARASESRLPEAMTDHDQSLLGFFAREAAPQDGLHTEEWKQVGGDTHAEDLLRALRVVRLDDLEPLVCEMKDKGIEAVAAVPGFEGSGALMWNASPVRAPPATSTAASVSANSGGRAASEMSCAPSARTPPAGSTGCNRGPG